MSVIVTHGSCTNNNNPFYSHINKITFHTYKSEIMDTFRIYAPPK